MYRVNYVQGNGYRCACCRHEIRCHKDFTEYDAAIQFMAEIEAISNADLALYEDEDDRKVTELLQIEVLKIDIPEEKVLEIRKKRELEVRQKKQQEECKEKSRKERQERKQLVALKQKYDKI